MILFSTNSRFIKSHLLTATILILSCIQLSLFAQVDFEQKTTITINEYTGPMLSMQNKDANAFAELAILNDLGNSLQLGISGSLNSFFNIHSTPYLFNGGARDFVFYSSTDAAFMFMVNQKQSFLVADFGSVIKSGRSLLLENPSTATPHYMSLNCDASGSLEFKSDNFLNGNPILYIGQDGDIAINHETPSAPLHIWQDNTPFGMLGQSVADTVGLKILEWGIYQNANDDLAFAKSGLYLAHISSSTGAYTNWSDRRLKENIEYLDPVLERVNQLKPASYNYIDMPKSTLGFIAQEVEEVFPALVNSEGEYKSLAYDHFAVLAIKAIQELSQQVDDLQQQVAELQQIGN